MTLNEILLSVRDDLGEQGEQLWKTPELVRHAQLAFNRHAREGYSVEAEVRTTSLPSVQEYDLPSDFGEPMAVRYHDEPFIGPVPLVYVDKQSITTAFGSTYSIGAPFAFYIFGQKLGLYPIPNKPPVFKCVYPGTCYTFANVLDGDTPYSFTFQLEVEPKADAGAASSGYQSAYAPPGAVSAETDAEPDLNPCRVMVSHIGVYLRRVGLPYAGNLRLQMSPMSEDSDYVIHSNPIPAAKIGVRPQWHNFDFTVSPIEINEVLTSWELTIVPDSDYMEESPKDRSGPGLSLIHI